jgi:hypothetical protein
MGIHLPARLIPSFFNIRKRRVPPASSSKQGHNIIDYVVFSPPVTSMLLGCGGGGEGSLNHGFNPILRYGCDQATRTQMAEIALGYE